MPDMKALQHIAAEQLRRQARGCLDTSYLSDAEAIDFLADMIGLVVNLTESQGMTVSSLWTLLRK